MFFFSHIGREHLDADSICQICSKVLKKESMGLHMSTAHKKSDPTTRRIQGYQMETETNPGIYACAGSVPNVIFLHAPEFSG